MDSSSSEPGELPQRNSLLTALRWGRKTHPSKNLNTLGKKKRVPVVAKIEVRQTTPSAFQGTAEERRAREERERQKEKLRASLKMERSKYVVNPQTNGLMQHWDMVTIAALLFVAFVTPFEVGFMKTALNTMFVVNRCIDMIFVTDMVLQFFLMYPKKTVFGLRMETRHGAIVKHYLKTWFAIDLLSILPFDSLGIILNSPSLQRMKFMKVVRLMRLLKLVRVFKASRVFKRWETRVAINYSKLALAKFLVLMIVAGHWMACFWGLCATETGDTMGGSWITQGGHEDEPPIQVYVIATYWSVMTLTSIGYGDITPVNDVEKIICIMLMLFGAGVWAFIIGQACTVFSQLDAHEQKFKQTLDDLNYMLVDRGIPDELRVRLRSFFFETKDVLRVKSYKGIIAQMSPTLQAEVACVMNEPWLKKVWYFNLPAISMKMIVACAQRVEASVFARGEKFFERGTLYIVNRGLVGRKGHLKRQGAVWGEDFILHNTRLMDGSQSVALTYVEMLTMHKEALTLILSRFPEEQKALRKAAIRIAVMRGIVVAAKARNPGFQPKGLVLSFGDNESATAAECSATDVQRLQLTTNRCELMVNELQNKLAQQDTTLNKCVALIESLGKSGSTGGPPDGMEARLPIRLPTPPRDRDRQGIGRC